MSEQPEREVLNELPRETDTEIEEPEIEAEIVPETPEEEKLESKTEATTESAAEESDVMVIGEEALHGNLMRTFRSLHYFPWFDRPIDQKSIAKAINQARVFCERQKQKKRILIVDDDPSYSKMVREWLKERYKVDIVTAGMQAITFLLKLTLENQVDLILLDYDMPVVDGPQVLQMLRQEPATKDIPVIFLTGVDTKEEVTRVMALKPEGYILKSTSKSDLMWYLKKRLE